MGESLTAGTNGASSPILPPVADPEDGPVLEVAEVAASPAKPALVVVVEARRSPLTTEVPPPFGTGWRRWRNSWNPSGPAAEPLAPPQGALEVAANRMQRWRSAAGYDDQSGDGCVSTGVRCCNQCCNLIARTVACAFELQGSHTSGCWSSSPKSKRANRCACWTAVVSHDKSAGQRSHGFPTD